MSDMTLFTSLLKYINCNIFYENVTIIQTEKRSESSFECDN